MLEQQHPRQRFHHLAALIESALTPGCPVRVVIDGGMFINQLWAYGDERSCKISGGGVVEFLIGLRSAAKAPLEDDVLGDAVAAWTELRVSLAELKDRVPDLILQSHAEMLEAGDEAGWHWRSLLDRARAEEAGQGPLRGYLPLIQLMITRPMITRFFSFTSVYVFCFSRSSNFPFVTDGLPILLPAAGGYTIRHAQEQWTGDAGATAARLEQILAAETREPFGGNRADIDVQRFNAEMVRLGSSLRARRLQHHQGYYACVIAYEFSCSFSVGKPWHVEFDEAGISRGSSTYHEDAKAITAVRRWLEDIPSDLDPAAGPIWLLSMDKAGWESSPWPGRKGWEKNQGA